MKKTILLAGLLFLFGCDNGIKNNFLGNYYLVAPDVDEQTSLSYHESSDVVYAYIISATIFAVGYNKSYIIVKQHPNNNRNITNYFILPVKNGFNWKTNNGLIGPLTLKQFEQKRIELHITSIPFTINYKNLE